MRGALTLLLLAGCGTPAAAPAPAGTGVVEFVIDGDTVDIVVGGVEERVRLLGVDAPETRVEGGPPECFGPEAAAHITARLAPGTEVQLARDVVARDDYGRLLAYVTLADDGTLINEELVRLGFARPLWIEPNGLLRSQFIDAARSAERQGLGLWGGCGG